MEHLQLHSWDVTPAEAVALQDSLKARVRQEPLPKDIRHVAGADISFELGSDVVHAGFVVLELPTLRIVQTATVVTRAHFPYVPGLLTFREAPPLLEAWRQVTIRPDVVVIDGHGRAHPRRLGVAAHLGLFLDVPTIGCAKSVLCGRIGELAEEPGSTAPITHRGELVGLALRTRRKVTPVYVSVGHHADLPGSAALLSRLVRGYRIPEPTRQAHLAVNAARVAHRQPAAQRCLAFGDDASH